METCIKEGDTYLLLQDLEYKDNAKTDVLSKNKLDLFLPKNYSTQTPMVVFVHGGGWLRGDRLAYRHYFSIYDTNLLVALAMAYYDAYWNVGKAFASNGVACAVISYRLSRLEFPWLALELCCSLTMSMSVILIPLLCVMLLAYSTTDIGCHVGITAILPLLIALSLVIIWIIICLNRERYFIAPQDKIWPLSTSLCITCIFSMLLNVDTVCIALCLMVCLGMCLLYSFAAIQQKWRPIVKHPSHISDVALSIKWIKHFAISSKMYDSNRIFLCGHSAGGHLVSLLALDSRHLEAVGLSLSDIKGVISISGIYNLHNLSGGGLLEHLFLRPAFGSNKQLWTNASPYHQLVNQRHSSKCHQYNNISDKCCSHGNQSKMSFLVINAEHDPLLTQDAQDFVALLLQQKYECQYLVIANANHLSVILSFGRTCGENESIEQYCLTFIK